MLNRVFLAFCGTVALGSLTWAAEHPRFVSQPVAGTILVDGSHDDWTGTVEPFGAEPVSIQVENDAAFLYLRLVASDPAARSQIMRRGLTVWFDEQGKTKKRFGLEYPSSKAAPPPMIAAAMAVAVEAAEAGEAPQIGRATTATIRPTVSRFSARTKTTSGA